MFDDEVVDAQERFSVLGPDDPQHAWIGGGYESFETLSKAFITAADRLATAWANDPHERLALPILQTYRHGIELALKGLCEQAAQHIAFGAAFGIGSDDMVPANLADRLGRMHGVAPLVDLFNQIAPGISSGGDGHLPQETQDILRQLHKLDSNGQTFRYATAYDKKAKEWVRVRPEEEAIDLRRLVNDLHHAGWMLVYGGFGWLDAYGDHLQNMYAIYEENRQSYSGCKDFPFPLSRHLR